MHGKKSRISVPKTKIFLALVVVGIFIASGGLSAMASIYENANAVNPASSGNVSPSTSSSSLAFGVVAPLSIASLNYFSPVECYYFVSTLYMPFAVPAFPPYPNYLEYVIGHYATHNATYESWNLTIKKDLKWDNGSPLTSKDLWMSLWLYNDTGSIVNVSSISIINSTTVNVILNSPQPNFVAEWVTYSNSFIFPYQTFYPLDKNYTKPLTTKFDAFSNEKDIVADSPYTMTNYTAGENPLIFTANKYYLQGPPKMSQITVRLFSSASSMSSALRSGEIDAIWDFGAYNTVVSPLFSGIANTKLYSLLPGGYMEAVLNMREWPYNTTQFRQALAYLTNRAALSSIVDEANAPMATYTTMTPSIETEAGINPSSISNYSYNVAKATTLLAEIGIDKDNAKGSANYGLFVYNNSALPCYGNPVAINITTAQFGYGDVSTSVELEDQWKSAGFEVSVTSVSSSSYSPLVLSSAKGWAVGISVDYSGVPPMDALDIAGVYSSDNSSFTAAGYPADYKASFGVENYNFKEISRLYNESLQYPLYTSQSNKYVQEAADMIAKTVPIIPLFYEDSIVAASNSYYWGNSTNHTGLFNLQATVALPIFWYGTLWAVHPLVSTTKVTSNFADDYVIIGVVIAVVVIGGAAVGISTSRKHKKQKASDKEEDDMESKQ